MRWLAAATLLVALLVPAPARAAGGCRIDDPRVTEASSLVDLGDVLVTANDSGDSARVFVLDPRTCDTVGVTSYGGTAVDVEAMAPAGHHAVWAGDVGDNGQVRSSISIARVPIARGDHDLVAPRYTLVYPDGPHDAESLAAAPDGQLYLVTKQLAGGGLYLLPRHLSPTAPNRLRRVGSIPMFATDATFTHDGRWLVVRGYDFAMALSYPGFAHRRQLGLPSQPQGEAIAATPTGGLLVGSEGHDSAILPVHVPAWLHQSTTSAPSATASPSASASPHPTAHGHTTTGGRSLPWLAGGAGAVLAVLLAAVVAVRRRGRE